MAWKVSSGGVQAIDPDQFEVSARRGPGGETLLWIRHIPDVATEPDEDTVAVALAQAVKALTDALTALKAVTS